MLIGIDNSERVKVHYDKHIFIFRMSIQNDTYVIKSHPTIQPSDDDKPGELGTARLDTSQDA